MKVKKVFFFWAAVLALLILFLPGYTRLQEIIDKNRDLEEKIKQLNAENNLLQQELKRIENDEFYQEKIAREKMGVVRKDEIPLKIIPEGTR
jgi:cell division protein FtsB